MRSLGITRKVDSLGRIVIPSELRKKFNIDIDDELEIFTENDRIILKKYEPSCTFCGGTDGLVNYNDRTVCSHCAKAIAELAKN